MFFVSDENLRSYSRPVQILMLSVAFVVLCVFFRLTFWAEFSKVLFTSEPRVPSDYAGFVLGICNVIVICITLYRIVRRVMFELKTRGME